MFLNLTTRSLLCACALISCSSYAENTNTLKTEYYEAAVSVGKTINYKRWNTFRDGKLIVTYEEQDLANKGTFDQIDTLIFHDGKKVLHFVSLQGKRSCFFHPEGGFTVVQGDSDGDGRYDQIIIQDAQGKMVDLFTIAVDGKVTPISDAELKKVQDAMKQFSEGMKNFDKR